MTNEAATISIDAQDGFLNESDEFAFLLEEVPRVLRKAFDESIAQFGLSRTQWRTLAYLIKTEGMTQTELANCLELERATIGLTIDRLEKLEFVERRSAEGDRRVWRIFLRPKAIEIIPELRKEADAVYNKMLKGISEADLATIRTNMEKMARNLRVC
ncbi:MarR family winged helix-turn-helix transcriptional regulator [Sphingorhabdus sp. SMR4y]|uniref:MarR family winged helix-turn-helix transcriptional regulator n=1 Tax=Sphingorhabdus sp. SMR4y TaxID=2584094 RepID=UPI000B5D0176|nr:MarR family transcriptional regulator [Sphingorhabdus sp. SMR4y]ASK89845.1 transcriptional regulator SlyA [Sphingorhabdus sp. SMR4y]